MKIYLAGNVPPNQGWPLERRIKSWGSKKRRLLSYELKYTQKACWRISMELLQYFRKERN